MSEHVQHRERLRALIEDAERAREAYEASELASCAACRAEVASALPVMALLDTLGREERAALVHASQHADPEREDRILRRVRARIEPTETGRASRRGALAAAGAVLAIAVLAVWRVLDRAREDPWLGGTPAPRLEPSGEGARFERFTWTIAPQPSQWFQVIVWDATQPDSADPLDESGVVHGQAWEPEDTETWSDSIRWKLILYDRSGVLPVDSWSATASR